jgi:hypothetical protein
MTTTNEPSAEELRALHDSIVFTVELSWADGTATIAVQTNGRSLKIVVSGVHEMHCPREMPWGPSECINEVALSSGPRGMQLEIEMQSGDTIKIAGTSVSLS